MTNPKDYGTWLSAAVKEARRRANLIVLEWDGYSLSDPRQRVLDRAKRTQTALDGITD